MPPFRQRGYDDPAVNTYMREAGSQPLLTQEEERELGLRKMNGDTEARNRLIEANLLLVISIAKTYRGHNVPLADLIEEGNIGLIYAVDKFDVSYNRRLSTYATYWIKRYVINRIHQGMGVISIPRRLKSKMRKVAVAAEEEETASEKECIRLAIAANTTRDIMECYDKEECRTEPVQTRGRNERDVHTIAAQNELIERARAALRRLAPKEQSIVMQRYGLRKADYGNNKTLEEVGQPYALTKERIRQLEGQALKKIRSMITDAHPAVSRSSQRGKQRSP